MRPQPQKMNAVRTYRVFGITCDHCKQTIEAALAEVDGVDLVKVDVENKTVQISGDAADLAIRHAITGAGYEVADLIAG